MNGGWAPGMGGTGGGTGSGVRGVLVVSRGGPVVREGREWPAFPLRGMVEVLRKGPEEAVVARTESDEAGRFSVPLPPGEYVVRARNLTGAPVPTAWPLAVRVEAGAVTEVTIDFDSGIR